jgi:hypothetical protein
MSLPVIKIYHCTTGSFSGSGFPGLLESLPSPFTSSTFGWNMGQNNPPLFCEMNDSTEVIRTSTQWQSTPTSSVPNNNVDGTGTANSWISGPHNGEFMSGSWEITMSMKGVSNNSNQTGRLIYRFWKGNNISGSNASLITNTFYSSSVNPPLNGPGSAPTIQKYTSSFTLPSTIFRNEYLFIQTYWSIVAAGTNNNADRDFIFGTSASFIKTSPFVNDKPRFMQSVDMSDCF